MPAQEKKCYCPFGCREADPALGTESEFDTQGYCQHLAGFLNLAPGQRATGRFFETLEPIYYPIRDASGQPTYEDKTVEETDAKGKTVTRTVQVPLEVHSGLMRVSGKKRQAVLETDVVIGPERLQQELTWTEVVGNQSVKHVPRLGIPTRVYRKGANTAVVTKPQDDDPHAELQARIEDKYADLQELEAKAKQLDLLRAPSDVDEEAQAAQAAVAEKRKMREPVTTA